MKERAVGLSRNLFLSGVVMAGGFLLTEVSLRVVGYEGDYERKLFQFSSEYSVVRRDSWVLHSPTLLSGDRITIGSDEIAKETPPGQMRFLFLGDSGTAGYGVPARSSFPFVFEQLMRRRGKNAKALNAGVYGFNTFDELALYRTRLRPAGARVVVLGLFLANDINTNLQYSPRIETPHWVPAAGNVLLDRSALAHYGYLAILSLNRRLRLWTGSADAMHYFSRISLIERSTGLHMLDYREGEIALYRSASSPLVKHAYELLERAMTGFASECQNSGAHFFVVLIPSPATVKGAYYSPIEPNILELLRIRGIEVTPKDLDVDRVRHRTLTLCTKLKITCIDPTMRLRAIGPSVFLPEDDHLSPSGHEAVAQELIDRL